MIKVKLKNKEIVDAVVSEESKQELIQEVFKKAKAVNQQMLRLERKEDVKKGSYAYLNAQAELAENKSIRSGSKKGSQLETYRFEESKKALENKTIDELNEELRILNKFKSAKTSSITGIKEVRKNKESATLEYAKDKVGVEINKKEYDKLMKAFENRRVAHILNSKLGSYRKMKKMTKALKGKDFDIVIKALSEAEEYLETHDENDKPKVKTEEEAEMLNELFGNVEIFGFQDYAPTLTDGLDKIASKAKFGGLI